MRIREITLREIGMKLIAPFEISSGVAHHRRIILLEANVDGVTGWAECVAGENPNYSPETVETAWHILRDHLWPLIKDQDFAAAIAKLASRQPSTSKCGSWRMISRSLQVPGSDSSALTTR